MFAERIRQLREEKQLLQRQISAALDIDNALYCKIERGDRRAKREQVIKLAGLLQANEEKLLSLWLADQVVKVLDKDKDKITEVFEIVNNSFNKK